MLNIMYLLIVAVPTLFSFQLTSQMRGRKVVVLHSEGIDVSGLKFIPIPEDFKFDTDAIGAVSSGFSLTDLSNALVIAGGLAVLAYEKRPRGSARNDLIEVKELSRFHSLINCEVQVIKLSVVFYF
jgi:hypothetical protein